MASFQVRALYDFSGEPNTAELTITAGEVLTVTRPDVGEGWWEGVNNVGKSGLFPAAYVEKVSGSGAGAPPSMPAPVLPKQAAQQDDDWGGHGDLQQQPSQDTDGWDDDWDDDTYSEIPASGPQDQMYANEPSALYPKPMQIHPRQEDADSISESTFGADNKGTVTKKSLNRFSIFVKNGGESYVLGTLKVNVDEQSRYKISLLEDGSYSWPTLGPSQYYTVTVTSPKRESKLKGLKSFIAYQLTPSFNNIVVSRRYKHFDWLHERLCEKFSLIAVPPLPEKQVSGRYEEQFIEHRRVQLQAFVDWVCRHPVLSYSEVWQHFLTCTDEKMWKAGKRRHEKDLLVGANFCLSVVAPEKTLLQTIVDAEMEKNTMFIANMDIGVKGLNSTCLDQSKKHQVQYKREFTKVGESFFSLGAALESVEKATPSPLTTAIKRTGTAYIEIGKYFEEQPKLDWEPLADKLHIYRGVTGAFPDIFTLHKGAQQKRKECEKINMQQGQLLQVQRRADVLSYTLMAEMHHFKLERDDDLKQTMQEFLNQQINFYQKIVMKLQETLSCYEN